MNQRFCEEMALMYICMSEFLKDDFIQEVVGTSMPYKRYVCDFWYFTHHYMMNKENIGYKVIYEVNPRVTNIIK